ncbi:MAG: hypothetical protein IPH18_00370 [Chitinophagaceae bacterium]|nr:hypothetical protein [Chitinophagaceae bacterium]
MKPQVSQLVHSILQKDTVEQCRTEELRQLVDSYPFFAPAHVILAKKLQAENEELYKQQLQKTFLYFNNPLLVEYLLTDKGQAQETLLQENEEIHPLPVSSTVAEMALQEPVAEPELQSEPAMEKETASIEIPLAEPLPGLSGLADLKPETAIVAKDELLFEPYYTVDYFASQGINLKEEEKPKDKFGQQLRSFTDWLKTLKKQPLAEITNNVVPASEQKVEQLAEHSLEEKEVITEAMAEVWEKQGNQSRAIALYTKLSLLEPAKSTYFAAKIDELKKLI